jgi:hypothetical protein
MARLVDLGRCSGGRLCDGACSGGACGGSDCGGARGRTRWGSGMSGERGPRCCARAGCLVGGGGGCHRPPCTSHNPADQITHGN